MASLLITAWPNWEVLAAKKIPPDLNAMLCNIIKIINLKKNNKHLTSFSNCCKDINFDYQTLLLYAGTYMQELQSISREHQIITAEKHSWSCYIFKWAKLRVFWWIMVFKNLSDIFFKLNDLNIILQENNCNIFILKYKVLWKKWMQGKIEWKMDIYKYLWL